MPIAHAFRPDEQPGWNQRGRSCWDWVTQWFTGERAHEGIDFGLAAGTPMRAGGRCEVVDVVYGWGGGWGNHVVLRYHLVPHLGAVDIRYAHLNTIECALGDELELGQRFATSGNTGASTGPHLHEETRLGFVRGGARGRPIDPRQVLDGIPPATPTPTPPVPPADPGDEPLTPDERQWLNDRLDAIQNGTLLAVTQAATSINGNTLAVGANMAKVNHHYLNELAQRSGGPLTGFTVNI